MNVSPLPPPIAQLLATKERLPRALQSTLLAMGDAAVAPLVAILEDDAHCDVDAPSAGWAPVHAVDLLIDLEATAAIAPMLQLVRDTEPDAIVHDRIVYRLPELGARVLEPALRHLDAAGDTPAAHSFCAILSRLGVKDERVYAAISSVLDRDPLLGAMLAGDYGDARALPRLRAMIAAREPDFTSATWQSELEELLEDYQTLGGALDDELRARVDGIAAAWKEHLAATGRAGGAKVGRNEPCPCGSGKKFKKCCAVAAVAASASATRTGEPSTS